MANRSIFPDGLDVFQVHLEIQASDVANVQRYQTLVLKESRTPSEEDELSNLKSILRDKILTSEDFNLLQDSMSNIQNFILNETEVFFNTEQQSAIQEIENKKQSILAYLDDTNVGSIRNDVGDMTTLTTTNKTSLVTALNEVKGLADLTAKTPTWTNITLQNGVTIYAVGSNPIYSRIGNVVYIKGAVTNISAANTVIGTLPVTSQSQPNVRPSIMSHNFTMPISNANATTARFARWAVGMDGTIKLETTSDGVYNSTHWYPIHTSFVIA